MSVFLLVLKIIGLVILCVIALLILLILAALFVPIRYKGYFNKETADSDFELVGKFSFLLHIFSGKISYNKELDYYLKVLNFKIKSSTGQPEDQNEDIGLKDYSPDEYTVDWNGEEKEVIPKEEAPKEETTKEESPKEDTSELKSDKPPKSKRDLSDIIDRITDKIAAKKQSYDDKLKSLKKKYRYWDKMLSDEKNKSAAHYIYVTILKILKKYIPYKCVGEIHFGFEDPSTTGSILMYLGMLYPILPKGINIYPEYNEDIFFGFTEFKGKIRLCHILGAVIKFIFNKEIRRLWKLYKKRP